MKKLFSFMAVAAIAVIAMTSCDPQQGDPTENVSISLSAQAIEIGVDETFRLQATIMPAGTNLRVSFKSQDESVATVSGSGLVKGIALGETFIVASVEGAESVSCKVSVSDMAVYNSFNIVDYGFFGEPEFIDGTDTIIELSIGDTKCKLAKWAVYAWDGNAQYVSGSGWAGEGYVMEIEDLYAYTISEHAIEDYVGAPVGFGGFIVEANEEEAIRPYHSSKIGKIDIDTYGEFVASQYDTISGNTDFDKMIEKTNGALLGEIFADGISNWYGLYSGKINKLIFYDAVPSRVNPNVDSIPVQWAIDLDWASLQEDRVWGFRIDTVLYNETYVKDEGGLIELIKPYDYLTVNRVFDEDGLFEEESGDINVIAAKNGGWRMINPKKVHRGETPKNFLKKDQLYINK